MTITASTQIKDGDIGLIQVKNGWIAKVIHGITRSKFDTVLYFIRLGGTLYTVKKDWYGIVIRPFRHYLNKNKYHIIIGTPILEEHQLKDTDVLEFSIKYIGSKPFTNFFSYYGSARMTARLHKLSNPLKCYPWTFERDSTFMFSTIDIETLKLSTECSSLR